MTKQILTLLYCISFPFFLLADAPSPTLESKPQEKVIQKEETSKESTPTKVYIPKDNETEDPINSMGDPPFIDSHYQGQFFKTLIAIVIIIMVALFVIWMIRRAGPSRIYQSNKQKNIKIIERRAISSQTFLYHVQVGDKQFIMSESKMDVRTLATLDWPESTP